MKLALWLRNPWLVCVFVLVQGDRWSFAQHAAEVIQSQTDEQIQRTLESLEPVDDLPLYRMQFAGDYDRLQGASERTQQWLEQQSKKPSSRAAPAVPPAVEFTTKAASARQFACSIFVAHGDGKSPLFGRNFDWLDHPALVLFTDPSDGYASVSLVDISYLAFEAGDGKLDSIEGRRGLLAAPLIPFDGMNETGLTVGMAAVPDSEIPFDSEKPTFHGLGIIRMVLDKAKNVDEALELFAQYNVIAQEGPQIHYLLADLSGSSALVELKDGERHVFRNDQSWQMATNFYYCGNEDDPNSQCQRYSRIARRLSETKGELSSEAALQLLQSVAQPNTRWSAVYDMQNRKLSLATARRFEQVHEFELD